MTHRVFLTQMLLEREDISVGNEWPTTLLLKHNKSSPWVSIIPVLLGCLLTSSLMILCFIYLDYTKENKTGISQGCVQQHCSSSLCSLTSCQALFALSYCVARIIYSLCFTFSFFIAVICILVQQDKQYLQENSLTLMTKLNISHVSGTQELIRQTQHANSMQRACSNYIIEVLDVVFTQVHHKTLISMPFTNIWRKRTEALMEDYIEATAPYTEKLNRTIRSLLAPEQAFYYRYLSNVKTSPWLRFSDLLFNKTFQIYSQNNENLHNLSPKTLQEINFSKFMGLSEVEETARMSERLIDRYISTLPQPEVTNINIKSLTCTIAPVAINITRMSSVHYFSQGEASTEKILGQTESLLHDSSAAVHLQNSVISSPEWAMLTAIVLSLDVLMLLYRLSSLYLIACSFCHGFKRTIQLDERYCQAQQQQTSIVTRQQTTQRSHEVIRLYVEGSPVARFPECARTAIHTFILSSRLPTILVFFAIVVLLLLCLQVIHNVFSPAMFVNMMIGQDALYRTISLQFNQTNDLLSVEAQYITDVVLPAYRTQAQLELHNIQSILIFFLNEQTRLLANLKLHACSTPYDVDCTQPLNNFTNLLMPCNFLPVTPKLLTDFNADSHAAQATNHIEPLCSALRNILTTFVYAVFVVIAVVALLHLAHGVLFHYLKTRQKFPVHYNYVTCLPVPGLNGLRPDILDTDYESDDVESLCHRGYTTTVCISNQSCSKPETLLAEVKFSETKV